MRPADRYRSLSLLHVLIPPATGRAYAMLLGTTDENVLYEIAEEAALIAYDGSLKSKYRDVPRSVWNDEVAVDAANEFHRVFADVACGESGSR